MVSAKGRLVDDIPIVRYADFIQTDAAINRGNSGGALINIRGELVGINTAIATGGGFSQGNAGVGFAIPINLAKRIMTQLVDKGEVERGWLGITFEENFSYEVAEKFGLDEPRGALVTSVFDDSPAKKSGLKHGDIILAAAQIPIRNGYHLSNVIAGLDVGKTIEIKVFRKGKEKILKVKIGKRTPEVLAAHSGGRTQPLPSQEDKTIFAGIHVRGLTDELAARYGYEGENGVIVAAVERRSPAARAQIDVGTLIQEIEGVEVSNLKDYHEQIKAVQDKAKVLLYVRQPNNRGAAFVTLENPSN